MIDEDNCVICGKDSGDRTKDAVVPKVCVACNNTYLSKGVMLINPHSKRLVVLKESAFKKHYPYLKLPSSKILICDDTVINKYQAKETKEWKR